MKIGFIGLGLMGGSMASNLQAAGHALCVHDISRAAATPHLAAGAEWKDTPRQVAEAADVVFTSLPGPPEVETVALGAVIHEDRFERGLHAGDDTLVDVALALFLAGGLDVEVDQLLAVDDRHPEFLRLGGIEQHAFHGLSPAQHAAGKREERSKAPRTSRGAGV
jgi:hypothetical protein